MSIGHRQFVSLIAVMAAMLMLSMNPAWAGGTPTNATPQVSATCKTYVGLTNHIAGCVRDVLDDSTSKFFGTNGNGTPVPPDSNGNVGIYPLVSEAIAGAMMLSVILFGIMGSLGALEKIGRDSMMLLVKIAMVAYFSTNSDWMYHKVIETMDATAQTVVSYIPENGAAVEAKTDGQTTDFSQITCLRAMMDAQKSSDPLKKNAGPWMGMDCVIDSVIGIKVDPSDALGVDPKANSATDIINGIEKKTGSFNDRLNGNDTGVSRGLMYLFFASYQTSIMGVILAVIGFIFMWGIAQLIIKALFIYLAGYIGIAVMMIISPIFIPLVLFQATRSYFDKWVKLVISFALQPIIILVFIAFTISAVDLAIFTGDYSIMYRIAGNASRVKGFSLNRYLADSSQGPDAYEIMTATNPPGHMNPRQYHTAIETKKMSFAEVKTGSSATVPMLQNAVGGITGIASSKCTKTLITKDIAAGSPEKLKDLCARTYAMMVYSDTIDWDLLAARRGMAGPVVQFGAPYNDAKNAGQQLSREVLAAALFAGIVVFVMNQLLKVVPMIAYDLFGDYGQSPNLGGVGGMIPGSDKLKKALETAVTTKGK